MELSIMFFVLVAIAALGEFIDSGIGMLYGTILVPVFILMGYDPLIVIPSILFSQAIGGFVASYQHHRHQNASLSRKSKDFKISSLIFGLGIIGVVVGTFVGNIIPIFYLKLYIGVLVTLMGLVVVFAKKFKFSWKKIIAVGLISSFNKALSGGGFGPLVATGLIASGQNSKNSIGATDFAEAPICITAFITWSIFNGAIPDLYLLVPLTLGAIIGGSFGPIVLSKVKNTSRIKTFVGIIAFLSGILMLLKLIF
jgi:uncharacterized membrane protein YfcA